MTQFFIHNQRRYTLDALPFGLSPDHPDVHTEQEWEAANRREAVVEKKRGRPKKNREESWDKGTKTDPIIEQPDS